MSVTLVDPALAHGEGRFRSADGLELYYQHWRDPAVPRRAVLVNLHGLGDHGGCYPAVVNHFAQRGLPVYAFDMRGNGRSPGQRAYIGSWAELRQDLRAFLRLVRDLEPGAPLFVMGNSLGGLVVLDYLEHGPEPLDGAVAVAPPLGALGVPRHLLLLARIASRVCPRFSLEVGMDLSGLSRDPSVVEYLLADPLFHRRGTARLGTEVERTIARVHAGAAAIAVPLLVLHGAADRMVPPEGSRRFFENLALPDRTLRIYDDAYHGLFADHDATVVLADLDRWIGRHLPAA